MNGVTLAHSRWVFLELHQRAFEGGDEAVLHELAESFF